MLDGASIYLEDDAAKIVLGPDTSIARAREGVLATSALQLGTTALCTETAHEGTLRFEEKLQICVEGDGGSVEWKSAGGGKFQHVDKACDATTAGLIRYHSAVFEACDGADWFVILGQPTSRPTASPTGVPRNVLLNNPEVSKPSGHSGFNSYNLAASRYSAKHFSKYPAFHSYVPDFHSRVLLCISMTGDD